ncbi:MAG TPA: CoA transferase [Trebonia sp.]|nr:CoA transferase [Trebonia sp.]
MTAADPGAASTGALAGLRVLEIAGPLGEYAGKLLADFGADVVLVEPPAGAARRHLGPFIDDQPGTERSLSFAYLNTSKRGVTLDLDQADGQAIFTRLARSADVVLDGTGQPGLMSKRGLGYEALAAGHPQLVYTAVTPFGSDGPYAGYQATDIIVMAMGGLLSLGGYGDGDPVRAGGDQACLAAGQFAAVGTLLAVLSAEQAGVGQFVDVSAQQAVVMAHENAVQYYDLEKVIRHRNGGDVRQAAVGMYQCQDGYVYVLAKGLGEFWKQLVDWLEAEQVEGAASLRDPRWQSDEFAASPEGKAEFAEIFGRLAANRTKAQLHEAAKRARIPLSPVNNPANLVASPQLAAREYFVTVEHPPTGRALRMPGAPVRLTASPAAVQRPAPALGQHNLEVLGELGLRAEDAVHLAAAGVI